MEEAISRLRQEYGEGWNETLIVRTVELHFSPLSAMEFKGDGPGMPAFIGLAFTLLPERWVFFLAARLVFIYHPAIFLFSLALLPLLVRASRLGVAPVEWYGVAEWILMGVSVLFHELGHAAALIRGGGKPGRIGGGFYLFMPVMFAEVTHAWKLNRKERLLVNVGGMYFEWLFASLLCLFSTVLDLRFGQLAALIILYRTVWNLNPFLRSDGYWILSDWFGESSLMKSSKDSLRKVLGRLAGRKKSGLTPGDFLRAVYSILQGLFLPVFLFFMARYLIKEGLGELMEIKWAIRDIMLGGGSFRKVDPGPLLLTLTVVILLATKMGKLIKFCAQQLYLGQPVKVSGRNTAGERR